MTEQEGTMSAVVVMVTTPSKEMGEAIAQALVKEQLAACVNLLPIHSIYTWEGEVNSEDEWQLLIKTDKAAFPALEKRICELHSYDVPEIIALPVVAGSQPYLQWIADQVKY